MSGSEAEIAASLALARGEALRALGLVGRLETPRGMLLRGIAYAQVGDFDLARMSLEHAAQAATRARDARTAARARAALVEIALSTSEPGPAARAARESIAELERLGDRRNATMQRLVLARCEVLLGRTEAAERIIAEILEAEADDSSDADLMAVALLADAEVAIRGTRPTRASQCLRRAREVLARTPNALLARALVAMERELSQPIARLVRAGVARDVDLYAIEAASMGDVLLVDACRRLVIGGRVLVPLARRPTLFKLLASLSRAWPASVPRDALAGELFEVRRPNASHRARLRVEVGRLRALIEGVGAEPRATSDGYVLASERDVAILLPPSDEESAHVALLLGDGGAWSAQGLAEHMAISKRTVLRAVASLVESGKVVRTGTGRQIRYARVGSPIASRMLLLGLVPKA